MLSKTEFEKLESDLFERIRKALINQIDSLIQERTKNSANIKPELNDSENILTGEEAHRFYEQIRHPPPNSKAKAELKKALKIFPDPDKPTELPLDL
jgi:hypothetical protein